VSSQEITELEFHISPLPSSSRPPDRSGERVGQVEEAARLERVVAQGPGLATASATSGMTPSRQRRTS
jgi:hypothetical protein